MPSSQIKVWDLPLRLFHWSLVAAFTIAYLSEDNLLAIHTYAGYSIAGLLLFRLLWGFIGTPYARFGQFVRPPRQVLGYLKQILTGRPAHYLGHNPAGGAMVLALLLMLALTAASGLVIYGSEEFGGPLAGLPISPTWGGRIEALHEFGAHTTLALVALHIAGVILASVQHRENLVRSMVTGDKSNPPSTKEYTYE